MEEKDRNPVVEEITEDVLTEEAREEQVRHLRLQMAAMGFRKANRERKLAKERAGEWDT